MSKNGYSLLRDEDGAIYLENQAAFFFFFALS